MGNLFPSLSEHTIRVLSMIGSWLAAGATLLAVGVSLWLALRSEKLRLQVSVNRKGRLDLFKGKAFRSRWWQFYVVNTGVRPITVQSVGWRWREKLRRKSLWDHSTKELPEKLEPGDHIKIESHRHYEDVANRLRSRKPVWTVVETAIGLKVTLIRPGRGLREVLRREGSAIPSVSGDDEPSAPLRDAPSDVETDPPGDPTVGRLAL